MKKFVTICVMLALVASLSFQVFADPGSFITSPSLNPGPVIIEFVPHDPECTARLVITPYVERGTLPENLELMIEKAYALIAGTEDITTLNADLAELAAGMGLAGTDLAVSDLFDIHMEGCDYHEEHKDFDIILKAESLNRFVGLLHMNKDGVFELVKGAYVAGENGDHLIFSVESFSPFAIVVDTTDRTPDTLDSTMIRVYGTIMIASAMLLVFVLIKSKKQEQEQ